MKQAIKKSISQLLDAKVKTLCTQQQNQIKGGNDGNEYIGIQDIVDG